MTFDRWWRRAFASIVVVLVLGGCAATTVHAQPPRTAAQEGFVPADQLPPPDEKLPAAPLLMAAYAIAWVAVLVYLWSIWQRLAKVERELADVSRRIESGARR